MELSQLRYFVAVAEAESISRAATALRIAQPAVSRRIRNLEVELGQRLFRRTDRGVTLTGPGRDYLERVREVLTLLEEANEYVRSGGVGQQLLHIGIDQLAQFYPLVNDLLNDYRTANPSVRFEWLHYPASEQVAALADGRIDVAIGATMLGLPAEMDEIPLFSLDRGIILSQQHPLAAKPVIMPTDLNDYPIVTTSRSTWFAPVHGWFEEARAFGFVPDFSETFDNVTLMLARLHDARTIAFYPAPGELAPMHGLVFRTVPHMELTIPVAIYWRREPQRPLIASFTKLVRQRLQER